MWRKTQKTLATFIPVLLLFVYLTVAICLLNRWDSMVAVTLAPVWVWSGLGMAIALLCWIICGGFPSIVMFSLCLATGIAFSEETIGIARELVIAVRGEEKGAPESDHVLRVVNVNCSGSEESLRKAIESKPDVVVIQKAPAKAVLDSVADHLYGVNRCVSVHMTSAIIASGEILGELSGPESTTLHVRIKLPDGFIIDVTNLDLEGCAPRLDMWRPSVWKQLIVARIENRRQVRASLGENEITRENIGRIISGGFGTPPGDDVYRPLETNGLIDTYASAGRGWGNTHPPDYPLLRLDQIWVSPNLKPIRSLTRLNSSSESRTVESEVVLPAQSPPRKG